MEAKDKKQEFELAIEGIKSDSIAEQLDLEVGDKIVGINDSLPKDYIEYKFLITDLYLELEIEKSNGELWVFEIEKDYDQDLGIQFSNIIFDDLKQCHNQCIFCFVDQAPAGCRDTLNLKDDDYRFSFLEGSYITLTNVTETEMSRIKRLHLSPLNISVHTTDQDLRQKMLKNKNATKILEQISELVKAGIELNTQIVLCPEINDGDYLEESILDLAQFIPAIKSLAVVPVGLTKHRDYDKELRSFTKREAQDIIELVSKYQQKFRAESGTNFIYLADEFYLLAGEEIPPKKDYDSLLQLENGVGLVRLFWDSFLALKDKLPQQIKSAKEASLITSTLGAKVMKPIVKRLNQIKGLELDLIEIKNNFFGHEVTVTGLLTGKDILEQLKERELKELIVIPEIMINDDDLFLDDLSWQEFEQALSNNSIRRVKNEPSDLVENILKIDIGGKVNG